MTVTKNLFANIPAAAAEEFVDVLVGDDGVRIERIISCGHSSPEGFWYDQEQDEWVAVLQGAARLRIAGCAEAVEMRPGDALHLRAHQRHRVEWTSEEGPTVWLAVHYGSAVDD